MEQVGFLIEDDQYVAAVAERVDGPVRDTYLEPSVAALDFGGIGTEGEGSKTEFGGGTCEVLACADNTADRGVATDAYNEIVSWHGLAP